MNYYNDIINKYNIMSPPSDLCVDYNIIKYNNINSILEIGAGGGGWSIGLNNFIDRPINITLIENFEFVKYNDNNYGKDWPKSKNELINFIDNCCKNHNIIVKDIDTEVINTCIYDTYDLIRIDCFEHDKEINDILQWVYIHLNKNGLVYIDDVDPRITIGRLSCALNFVKQKKFKLLCINGKSSVFSKWESDLNFMNNDILKKITDENSSIRFKNRIYKTISTDNEEILINYLAY